MTPALEYLLEAFGRLIFASTLQSDSADVCHMALE